MLQDYMHYTWLYRLYLLIRIILYLYGLYYRKLIKRVSYRPYNLNTAHCTQLSSYRNTMKALDEIFLWIDFLVQWTWLYVGFCHQNIGSLHCSDDGGDDCRNEATVIPGHICNRQMTCTRWIRLWIWKRWLPSSNTSFKLPWGKSEDWIENYRGDVSLWSVLHILDSMWTEWKYGL